MTKKPGTKPTLAPAQATETPAPSNNAPLAAAGAAPRITKLDRLFQLLSQPGGASIAEITMEMKVLPHSARAQISTLRKKRGMTITLADGKYTVVPAVPEEK